MLKETPRSLRQYFALISVLSVLPFVAAAVQGRWSAFASVSAAFDLLFVGLLLYITVRFHPLLRKPTLILVVLTLGAASMLISYVVGVVRSGVDARSGVVLVLALLIYWYLVRSVIRLSREAAQQVA